MSYRELLKQCEANSYIINMISVEDIVKTGFSLGLSDNTTVLDLCCGYGEMLKIWSETFGIHGTGIDRDSEFIDVGKLRLVEAGIKEVTLIEGDILEYTITEEYDVVSCTEKFGSISETLAMLEKYVKLGGKIVFGHLFSKIPNPPKELIDFDGSLPTLDELYGVFRELGYYVTSMTSDTVGQWDQYITWSARRDIERLRKNKDDTALAEWIEKWFHMYFNFRRPYEGQAMFGLERL
jgi:ubiquinone/menaquinone biosynthesis C-methylase UbiE